MSALTNLLRGISVVEKPSEAPIPEVVPRPPLPSNRLTRKPADPKHEAYLAEYAELATVIGVKPPDLAIEEFKALLLVHDLPVFSLHEVVAYMDKKAAQESKHKAGWEWRPLRDKDHLPKLAFGRAAGRKGSGGGDVTPASDYYSGAPRGYVQINDGFEAITHTEMRPQTYDRTIPLHALRRVALIEREHEGPVAFFVSDYALAPEIRYPDPFLMAVIPNVDVSNGTGRFVIDFWDEPGFGIEQMLK